MICNYPKPRNRQGTKPKPIAERFWPKVAVSGPLECWLWTAATNGEGYGVFRGRQCRTSAHRTSYELAHGPIPEGLIVRHSCDNPTCVNPAHLLVGTHRDNTNDKLERERQARGVGTNTARLSEAEVAEIRLRVDRGEKVRGVARRFGIDHSNVSRIKNRKTWKHLS